MRIIISLILTVVLISPAIAIETAERVEIDSRYEKRFRNLASELRCLVCQNQTLFDSNAPLARDLRHEIIGMMRQGKSDKEIIDFLVARYGDFVLYRPPLKPITYMLWAGPFLLLLIALIGVTVFIRKRKALTDTDFTAEESNRIKSLLEDSDGDGDKDS